MNSLRYGLTLSAAASANSSILVAAGFPELVRSYKKFLCPRPRDRRANCRARRSGRLRLRQACDRETDTPTRRGKHAPKNRPYPLSLFEFAAPRTSSLRTKSYISGGGLSNKPIAFNSGEADEFPPRSTEGCSKAVGYLAKAKKPQC